MRDGHAAIFEVKFCKETERTTIESRERSAEQLFDILEPAASAVEGSDIGSTEDPIEPAARCVNDAEKSQLVTRSGPSRSRRCACHLHHKWAMKSPAAIRQFFNTVLQQGCHLKVDVIAGDANAAAYKYY